MVQPTSSLRQFVHWLFGFSTPDPDGVRGKIDEVIEVQTKRQRAAENLSAGLRGLQQSLSDTTEEDLDGSSDTEE